jgi:hypothetical protein
VGECVGFELVTSFGIHECEWAVSSGQYLAKRRSAGKRPPAARLSPVEKPRSNPKCKAIKRLASRLATPCQSPRHSRKRNRRWTQINADECENAYLHSLAFIGGSKFLGHSLLVNQNDFAFFWTLAGPVRFRPRAIRLASRAPQSWALPMPPCPVSSPPACMDARWLTD